ncbi:MAG: RnfABCDGE type electron transport complex subunit D [Halopseudomonas sp.]
MKISIPQAAPHVRNPGKVPSLMGTVIAALVPVTGFAIYQYGWPALNLIALCLVSAIMFEALCLHWMGKPIKTYLMDGSGLLTALLLALSLPPWAPWWIAVFGSGFAVLLGKQVFGGIGQNPFNPAMLARVALLLSFPLEMTSWIAPTPLFSTQAPGFLDALQITFLESARHSGMVDSYTSATLLGTVKTELGQDLGLSQIWHNSPLIFAQFSTGWADAMLLGRAPGSLGESSTLLVASGGLYLLYQRIINWQLPVSMLATLTLVSTSFYLLDPESYSHPLTHLTAGGVMLAAFFIITDPVTSPCTTRGQLIFGAGCALLIYVIRTWGGYPEGVAFAVLLMNALTPLIDHYIRPRRYGRTLSGKPIPAPLSLRLKRLLIGFNVSRGNVNEGNVSGLNQKNLEPSPGSNSQPATTAPARTAQAPQAKQSGEHP